MISLIAATALLVQTPQKLTETITDAAMFKNGYAVTWEPEILRAIAQGKGPRRTLFSVGYAGWGPGQVEAEMKTGHWVKAAADEAVVFDDNDETKWDRAMARRKIDL